MQEISKDYNKSISIYKLANNNSNKLIYLYDNEKNEEIYNDNVIIIDNLDDKSFSSNSLSGSSKKENM